ncbi:hypothetical protein AK830_g4693 [Neonectria ditissima]|uniref:AB hydrolase-1 domain-containing protein n=1 Tax=Neonectria ditissima TaxID=78410 RepID=A0A0P7BN85_9HYPO|nr:hypothetical protein AK830_g4693 [Neonectria ditissima]
MTTYETAEDQYVAVGDVRLAYRKFGQASGTPLVLFVYFRGTMDHWDPAFINPLSAQRPIVLIDNSGIGRSGGVIPETVAGFAQVYIDAIKALGLSQVDLLGFSLGGAVAQMAALNAPALIRRLILCGTIPSYGDGVVAADMGPFLKLKDSVALEEHKKAFLAGFFRPAEESQALGELAWERITQARPNGAAFLDVDGANKQAAAFGRFMNPDETKDGSYNRLGELRMPVLVAGASDDILMPTENSIMLWKKLRNAAGRLHLFPDSGHGFLFQHAKSAALLVNTFLDSELDN